MLTRRKTLFRSLPFRATYSSKMNAQMPHTNNCIVCTVIIPSFSISVSLSLFIYVFLFSLPFRFVCFLLWWWYWYFSSIMILHLVTKCTKCGALAFLLLLFYYIIMCVGAASFSTFFAFASFSSFSVTRHWCVSARTASRSFIFPLCNPSLLDAIQCTYLPSILFPAGFILYLVRVLMLLAHLVAHSQRHPCNVFHPDENPHSFDSVVRSGRSFHNLLY